MGNIIAFVGIVIVGYAWLWLYSSTDLQSLFLLGSVATAALGCGCEKGEKENG